MQTSAEVFKNDLVCRRVILQINEAQRGACLYSVNHLDKLKLICPEQFPNKDGSYEFVAEAEFFFVPKDEGGNDFSTGDRIRFHGKLQKNGSTITLCEPVVIDSAINTAFIKTLKTE